MKKFIVELHDPEITKIGIAAMTDFYQTMSIDHLYSANAVAFATGIDSPFLNVVIDTRPHRQNSSSLIKSVSNFFDKHHAPWGWLVAPASHENDLIQQGFSLLEEAPAMYFNLSNSFSILKNELIILQELSTHDDLKTWIQPINEGFQATEGEDSYRKLNVDKSSSGKLLQFVAHYQNNLAAAGTLFISNDSVMLHNLATKTAFTKRGIGTALTLYMMNKAKQLGFKHCFLDSSEDGFNLYKKVGFKIYSTTLTYTDS
ncbi:MAG: GNAT family N-acetyltransferase [Gammaproteobacteria bacterium]